MWFFNKKNKVCEEKKEESNKLEKVDVECIKLEIADLIENLEKETGDRTEILTQIGNLYYKIRDDENAIKYYEESLEIKKNVGEAYKNLLNLYNKKLREFSIEKDDEKINYYLEQIDKMMKISKDVIRGNL